jgi:cytochrome c2
MWLSLIGMSLLSLTACQPNKLDDALKGQLPMAEGNQVIMEYCQSCHIHRAFDPTPHLPRMHALYDRQPYTATPECRVCHLVDEDTWGMKRRKTLWPAQVAQRTKGKSPK